MIRILMYVLFAMSAASCVFLNNYTVSVNRLGLNQYKLTCWLCDDFISEANKICDKQFGWTVTNQYLGRFNIVRSITISCKDAWGHYHVP